MYGYQPFTRRWSGPAGLTQTLGTAIVWIMPPMPGCISHVSYIEILQGGTAHTLVILRPLNFTTVAAAVSGSNVTGQAVVTVAANPGTYSKNYMYQLGPTYNLDAAPPGLSAPATLPTTFQVADLTVGASMYLVFEMPDNCYYFDVITSISGLQFTMTANLPINFAVGSKVWLMGKNDATSLDPATNQKAWNFLMTASTVNKISPTAGAQADLFQTLHPGDPILFFDGNATAADTVNRVEGYYSKY